MEAKEGIMSRLIRREANQSWARILISIRRRRKENAHIVSRPELGFHFSTRGSRGSGREQMGRPIDTRMRWIDYRSVSVTGFKSVPIHRPGRSVLKNEEVHGEMTERGDFLFFDGCEFRFSSLRLTFLRLRSLHFSSVDWCSVNWVSKLVWMGKFRGGQDGCIDLPLKRCWWELGLLVQSM